MRLFSSKKSENVNATEPAPLLGVGETTDEALHATMHKPLEEWLIKTSEVHSPDLHEQLAQLAVESYQQVAPNPLAASAPIEEWQQNKDNGSDYHSNLGKVITILLRSSDLKGVTLAQVEQTIVPAIASGQFIIAETREENGKPRTADAVVTWANVSEDVNQRLINNIHQSLLLNAEEWRSGDIPWLVFAAGNRGIIPNIIRELVTKMLGGRVLRTRRVDDTGKAFVDEIDASKFESKQVETAAEVEVARNDPCPCGSGKRFKHCHGVLV